MVGLSRLHIKIVTSVFEVLPELSTQFHVFLLTDVQIKFHFRVEL